MVEANGIMAFWADIDAEYVTEFRRWHNCQHMLERVSIPGFLTGRRYCGSADAAMFLMYYETEAPEALASQAYHDALNNPTPWTSEALKHFRNPARNIYRLLATSGADVTAATPFLATIRFNLAAEDASILACYREKILPNIAAEDGVKRVRLWTIDEEISGIMTSERKIYSGGPGQQRYLLIIELMSEREAIQPSELPGQDGEDAARHINIFSESGWLDFALENSGR